MLGVEIDISFRPVQKHEFEVIHAQWSNPTTWHY